MAGSAPSEVVGCREAASPLPKPLARVVRARFPEEPRAASLLAALLKEDEYNGSLAMALTTLGRGQGAASWALRLLAAAMLEHLCLRLTADATDELSLLFVDWGLLTPGACAVDADVLRQGYTATDVATFSAEFLRHLRRMERVHRRLDGFRTTVAALEDFIALSRDPCKLALARFFFTPEEVVARAAAQLQISSGIPSPLEDFGDAEAKRYLSTVPAYEREIVNQLRRHARIYWACGRTSSGINRLLENPLGTVACVVKPPGSSLEIEIKRTGRGGDFPLSATFHDEDGEPVPPSHRLEGGASTAGLRWEGDHAAILAHVYRAAHDCEAPVSKLVALASYRTVPCEGRDVHLLDYFTEPGIFGRGFQKMRQHMKQCVSAYDQQFGRDFAHLPGEAGLTGRFLFHVLPCQALIAQTSSFRLDLLASYLSAKGAEIYFEQGLKQASYTKDEARRFADALLDEVLGVYLAPDVGYVDHAQYLVAALAISENRKRADALHAAAIGDLGLHWGTVLALGGFTHGESYVGRNMGMKSGFVDGHWTARLISMDHDNLHIPDNETEDFWPQGALRTAILDECFIRGNPGRPKQVPRSSIHFLAQIYQVPDDARSRAFEVLHEAMHLAYQRTLRAVRHETRMRRLFTKSYRRHLEDWKETVIAYLGCGDDERLLAEWKIRTRSRLTRRKYPTEIIDNYVTALEKHGDVVKRYAFLYQPVPSEGAVPEAP